LPVQTKILLSSFYADLYAASTRWANGTPLTFEKHVERERERDDFTQLRIC
jgi:hypothetical protein